LHCKTTEILTEHYGINKSLINKGEKIEKKISNVFYEIDRIREFNQYKVIKAMQETRISDFHFNTSTGYGYGDIGRDALEDVYAYIFKAEKALVRAQIVSGTHAIALVLFGLLRPGDEILSITGPPYDTLKTVIGIGEKREEGTLKDWGINYNEINLLLDKKFDVERLSKIITSKTKMILIQRSRGYSWRESLTIEDIKELVDAVRNINQEIIIFVDNCYGEFVEKEEPIEIGADIIAGSLIKNPGGGLSPTGGYIVGNQTLVEQVANRLTAPGLGKECGPALGINLPFYMGLFNGPHIVGEAIKAAIFTSKLFESHGFDVSPKFDEKRGDIIQAIKFNERNKLIRFCQGIQKAAPIDSYVQPEPYKMPGYEDEVIMAGGTFIQGSSIELSADAPLRPPYIGYFQGSFNYSHGKLGALIALSEVLKL